MGDAMTIAFPKPHLVLSFGYCFTYVRLFIKPGGKNERKQSTRNRSIDVFRLLDRKRAVPGCYPQSRPDVCGADSGAELGDQRTQSGSGRFEFLQPRDPGPLLRRAREPFRDRDRYENE